MESGIVADIIDHLNDLVRDLKQGRPVVAVIEDLYDATEQWLAAAAEIVAEAPSQKRRA